MDYHEEIRTLLALAAAGDLAPEEQHRVDAHLRQCATCRQELATLRALVADLRVLPAPQPSLGLAARTRARVAAEMAARTERRRHHVLLGLLILFAWIITVLSVAGARYFAGDLGPLFRLSRVQFEVVFTSYAWLAAVATAAFAGLAGPRHQAGRRTS